MFLLKIISTTIRISFIPCNYWIIFNIISLSKLMSFNLLSVWYELGFGRSIIEVLWRLASLRENCANTKIILVRIFPYLDWIRENTDQKKLLIWILFTQCIALWKVTLEILFFFWSFNDNFANIKTRGNDRNFFLQLTKLLSIE